MRGIWKASNWAIVGDVLALPTGRRIPLKQIRQWQEDHITGRADLSGQWPGWRIRQQFLIALGGSMRRGRVSENYLRHVMQFADWERMETSRRQLALF
jgi:hypothetical protein